MKSKHYHTSYFDFVAIFLTLSALRIRGGRTEFACYSELLSSEITMNSVERIWWSLVRFVVVDMVRMFCCELVELVVYHSGMCYQKWWFDGVFMLYGREVVKCDVLLVWFSSEVYVSVKDDGWFKMVVVLECSWLRVVASDENRRLDGGWTKEFLVEQWSEGRIVILKGCVVESEGWTMREERIIFGLVTLQPKQIRGLHFSSLQEEFFFPFDLKWEGDSFEEWVSPDFETRLLPLHSMHTSYYI